MGVPTEDLSGVRRECFPIRLGDLEGSSVLAPLLKSYSKVYHDACSFVVLVALTHGRVTLLSKVSPAAGALDAF